MHLGAVSSTVETDADLIVESNVRLTLRLWDWSARHRVPFLYASSAAVYGDGAAGFEDSPAAADLAALRPLNPYGWSKLATDRRIAELVARGMTRPPQWAGLRFFNVYGPNEYHKGGQQSLVPQLYRQVEATGRAALFRSYREDYVDGGQERDFVWIDDVVSVMTWLLDRPAVSGLFNVGSGRAPAIDFVDMPESLRERYQYHTCARLGRLRAAGCPFQPTPLEDGVRRYVERHLGSEDRYR